MSRKTMPSKKKGAMMKPKIQPEHLQRGAIIYVRQSSYSQVIEHTESQRRQYGLVDTAKSLGFSSIDVIDDDLGKSGSGVVERPGFQKLVAMVCAGGKGAILCIEASRLARNGRDWHHLIDLCALVGTLVIDPDGVYDPRLVNDRLLLGLKGTMSEYELTLLRQRGLAARDSKAKRGELRFSLPPGYYWNELSRIEKDPDERVVQVINLVFSKFKKLGSARQLLLWFQDNEIKFPVMKRKYGRLAVEWKDPAYHSILLMLRHPVYAGAYVFGRTNTRTKVVDGRALKTVGHRKSLDDWSVLIRDNHPGFISWSQFEENQQIIENNAHMKKRTSRKSARGGRALLAGLVRCARCGRMMRVFYGSSASQVHRYHCMGDDNCISGKRCIGIGGVRIDKAVSKEILNVVSEHAVKAAILAVEKSKQSRVELQQALIKELEQAE